MSVGQLRFGSTEARDLMLSCGIKLLRQGSLDYQVSPKRRGASPKFSSTDELVEDLFISANHCEYDLIGIGTHLTDASQNYDSRVTVENETQQSVVGITYVRSVCGIAERLWPNIPSHALYTTHLNHQRVEDLDPRVHDVYQQSGYAFSPHDTEAKPLSCRIRLTRLQASNVVTIAQQLPGSTLMPYVSRGEYTLEELQERHSAVIYKSLN